MKTAEGSIIAGLKEQVRALRQEIARLKSINIEASGQHLRTLRERDEARQARDEACAELGNVKREYDELSALYKCELESNSNKDAAVLLLQRDTLYTRLQKAEKDNCALKAQVEQYRSLLHG